ncbi:MAG: NAD-dependent epimerase/dehydratase family protein [Actinomycetota bacterium]
MSDQPVTVAVTGAAGYVGSRLIQGLCADARVSRVLGFDLRPPEIRSDKFVFDTMDIRDERLAGRLTGVDVLVHLAFVMDPIADESKMRDVNVNGSQNVFNCAADANVGKLVYTSSATVYGAHPDNEVPLTEESPLRANLDFSYAAHKLEVEYIAKEFGREHSEILLTVFRPALVFGAGVDNAWSHFIEAPVLLAVKGHAPPFQFVHEDEMVAALAFAVFANLDGVFNLAPRGWLENDEAAGLIGRGRTEVSEPVAFSLMERLWRKGFAEAPPGMMHYLMHPWVLSAAKLAEAGFVCERSSADTLNEALSHMRPYVRIGQRRLRRSTLRRGATAAAGIALAAGALGAARRRGPG